MKEFRYHSVDTSRYFSRYLKCPQSAIRTRAWQRKVCGSSLLRARVRAARASLEAAVILVARPGLTRAL